MAYIIFEKGHTISADDFNNNYYHAAQEDMLPLGGASLETTDSVYDLGSASYKWDNVHIQNLELQADGEAENCLNLIAEITLTTTATTIEITGLNGETDIFYEIISIFANYTESAIALYANGDSASNYGWQQMQSYTTSVTAHNSSPTARIVVSDSLVDGRSKSNLSVHGAGSSKLFLIKTGYRMELANKVWRYFGSVWNNSDTLTSFKLTTFFDVGTNIQIWSRR